MRAKAYVNQSGVPTLVDCIPYKIGFVEGFLNRDIDNPSKWNHTEFTTGNCTAWCCGSMQEAIDVATTRINGTTPERFADLLSPHAVINKTYQNYIPIVGDVVRIVKPENPIGWSESMERYIGRIEKVEKLMTYRSAGAVEVENTDCLFDFLDGDFIPVTALEREFVNEPVLGAAANFSTNGFIVEGGGANEESVIDFLSIRSDLPKKPSIKVSNEVVFSSSFLDFLHSVKQESRIARIILSVRELQYNGVGSLITNVLTASEVNYLTYRGDNGNISYLPKGKEHKVTEDGKWDRDGRQDGKAGKVMRKIFTKSALKLFKETDFEIFNNKFKARFEDGLKFAIETDISDVYLNYNRSDDGSLGSSCMRDVNADYFDIYTNCDKLSIVTLRDKDDVLQGRALLWDVVIDGQDVKFIDRFYVSKDSYYDKFVEFASEKGYWRKKYYKTYDSKTLLVSPDGTEREVKLKIKTRTDFEYYPYIDTFSYGEEGTLTNYEGQYTYNNTDGTRNGDGLIDDLTGDYIDEDDAVHLADGRITHIDNAICVTAGRNRYVGNYYPANECFRCGDEFYHKDDVNRC